MDLELASGTLLTQLLARVGVSARLLGLGVDPRHLLALLRGEQVDLVLGHAEVPLAVLAHLSLVVVVGVDRAVRLGQDPLPRIPLALPVHTVLLRRVSSGNPVGCVGLVLGLLLVEDGEVRPHARTIVHHGAILPSRVDAAVVVDALLVCPQLRLHSVRAHLRRVDRSSSGPTGHHFKGTRGRLIFLLLLETHICLGQLGEALARLFSIVEAASEVLLLLRQYLVPFGIVLSLGVVLSLGWVGLCVVGLAVVEGTRSLPHQLAQVLAAIARVVVRLHLDHAADLGLLQGVLDFLGFLYVRDRTLLRLGGCLRARPRPAVALTQHFGLFHLLSLLGLRRHESSASGGGLLGLLLLLLHDESLNVLVVFDFLLLA